MYAFVFRRIMDFDQMMPVAVAMADAGHKVRIGVMGDELDIADDARLSLLPGRPRVWRLRRPFTKVKCAAFLRGARTLVMDWAQQGHFCTATLTDIARRQGIASISLPHGVDHAADPAYFERLDTVTFSHFDHVVVANRIRYEPYVAAGVPPARLHVLGAPRFTSAWLARLAPIYPPRADDGSGRLKAVFFEQKIPERFDAMVATLDMLAAMECVDLVIQPKPIRHGREDDLRRRFPDHISTEHASGLCAWADVVIGTSSTVMFEAMVRKKHLVWTRHLDTHDLCYRTHGGAWIVDGDDDLAGLLQRLHRESTIPPVDGTAFCRDLLWAGRPESEIAAGYCRLLETASGMSLAA